jgi:hypothetical protein
MKELIKMERLYHRHDPSIAGAIYVKIDKHKTTQLDLINKIFLAAQSFGYVSYIKMVTVSAGDDAFRKSFNVQEARTLASHNQMKVTKSHPTEDLISFIEQNSDITEMHIDLGTTCYNENYEWEVFGEAITLSFYTEADEEDWGLYIKVNTDIFVPFRWVRDERTEEMAQKNAPKLKQLIQEMIGLLPVTQWEWEEYKDFVIAYLEGNILASDNKKSFL